MYMLSFQGEADDSADAEQGQEEVGQQLRRYGRGRRRRGRGLLRQPGGAQGRGGSGGGERGRADAVVGVAVPLNDVDFILEVQA